MLPVSMNDILPFAKESIALQAKHLNRLEANLDSSFSEALDVLFNCKGRVIFCGIGKSAIIAQKIAATFNSTGTPSMFLHAAEAVHGDLGMVQPNDVVLMISNSGNSPEIKVLLPLLLDFDVKIIGVSSNPESNLAISAHVFLKTELERESDPNNLAPTCSTTMQLVMGDALAVSLIRMRKFGAEDFAKYHPGGSLGKKLYLSLEDVLEEDSMPEISSEANVKEVVKSITDFKLGATVVTKGGQIHGIITDGDIRRYLLQNEELNAGQLAGANPLCLESNTSAYDAFQEMEKRSVSQVVILKDGRYIGLVHLHQILKAGIF
jgi:arabinose-5-phosphate isomerase